MLKTRRVCRISKTLNWLSEMAIYRLDKDFFFFLDKISMGAEPWHSYRSIYLDPHREFLETYWQCFENYNESMIRERVKLIRIEHYGQTRSLFEKPDTTEIIKGTLDRCMQILPLEEKPDIYLFVGFFSHDGFVILFKDRPVIGIGCERFKYLDGLSALIAHEYGHIPIRSGSERPFFFKSSKPAKRLIAEGIAIHFSLEVLPQLPLYRHLFLSPGRLGWCRQHEEKLFNLWEKGFSEDLFFTGDPESLVPPRVGYFLAYRLVERIKEERWPKRPIHD